MTLLGIIKKIWGPPEQWEYHQPLFKRAVMRRKVKGEWQYREVTEKDAEEFLNSDAW